MILIQELRLFAVRASEVLLLLKQNLANPINIIEKTLELAPPTIIHHIVTQ